LEERKYRWAARRERGEIDGQQEEEKGNVDRQPQEERGKVCFKRNEEKLEGYNPCGGGVEYLHREPASRKRRRNGTKNGRAIA
jgi:hypothetical protein